MLMISVFSYQIFIFFFNFSKFYIRKHPLSREEKTGIKMLSWFCSLNVTEIEALRMLQEKHNGVILNHRGNTYEFSSKIDLTDIT